MFELETFSNTRYGKYKRTYVDPKNRVEKKVFLFPLQQFFNAYLVSSSIRGNFNR